MLQSAASRSKHPGIVRAFALCASGCLWASLIAAQGIGQSAPSLARPLISQAIDDAIQVPLSGNTHPLATAQFDKGAVDGSFVENRMLLTMRRNAEQEQALQALLKAQLDPHSPEFHKWITPEEFGRRFGASTEDLNTVTAWLKAKGFAVAANVPNSRSYIEFSGTAGQVRQAFHTEIHKYVVAGVQHHANASDPQIPEALSPAVTGIVSLHDFHSQTGIHSVKAVPSGSGTNGAPPGLDTSQPDYTFLVNSTYWMVPYDFYKIYNETPLLTAATPINGQGVNIAVVARSNLNTADVSHFRSALLPSYAAQPVTVVVDGTDPGDVGGDDQEAALDVEWASSTAPAATVSMVVAASTNSSDGAALAASYIVNHNVAPILSTSFHTCEASLGNAGNTFYLNLWQQAASEGITVVANTGDSGSAGCESSSGPIATHGLNVNGVASTPYNIAVGGTEFNESGQYSTYWNSSNGPQGQSAKSYIPEVAWNESCPPSSCGSSSTLWAGGGGVSKIYGKPAWQTGVAGIPGDSARDVPDVSVAAALHDGYYIYLKGGYYLVGGTSASAPAFAGIMALVNQKTGSRQGQAAPNLYTLAAAYNSNLGLCNASNSPADNSVCVFYDVTQGKNAVPCSGGSPDCSSAIAGTNGLLNGYNAGAGYDLATGLGSVNVAKLVTHWVSAGVPAPSVVSVSPTGGSGMNQSFTFTYSDAQGAPSIGVVDVLINSSLDGRNACYVAYNRPRNLLYLVADNGTDLAGPVPLGGAGSLSNSQCTVQASGSSVLVSGNTMALTLNLAFKAPFAGNKVLYVAGGDTAGNNSGWNPAAVWQIPGAASTGSISMVSMNPNHGSGTAQTFVFVARDTSGWQDLGIVNVLVNAYLDGRKACYIAYSRPQGVLYLVGDDGSSLLGPMTLGGSGSLSNGQCSIASSGSSAVGSGNNLTLTLKMTFTNTFGGDRIFYTAGRDAASGNNTGWQALGAWTVQ